MTHRESEIKNVTSPDDIHPSGSDDGEFDSLDRPRKVGSILDPFLLTYDEYEEINGCHPTSEEKEIIFKRRPLSPISSFGKVAIWDLYGAPTS